MWPNVSSFLSIAGNSSERVNDTNDDLWVLSQVLLCGQTLLDLSYTYTYISMEVGNGNGL